MTGIQNMVAPVQTPIPRLLCYESAIQTMPIAVVVTDRDGNVECANESAEVFFEMGCTDLIGSSILELVCERNIGTAEEAAELTIAFEGALRWGATRAALPLTLKNGIQGKGKHFSLSVSAVRNPAAEVIGAVVTMAEIGAINKPAASVEAPQPQGNNRSSIFVRSGGKLVRVRLQELQWVEAMENYVLLQTLHEKLIVHTTMKTMEDVLSDKGYQRIHRSFIVRTADIERIEENQVMLNGAALPIGKSYRNKLLEGLTLI